MSIKKVLPFIVPVVLAGLGLTLPGRATAQTAYTPISNVTQPFVSAVGVFLNEEGAVSFITGSTPNFLVSVSVFLGLPGDGSFALFLYNDAAGSPGSSLATLSGNSYPASDAVSTFTNSSPLLLAADTTYWIVASSPGSVGMFYNWLWTSSTNLDAGSIWQLDASKYGSSGNWNALSGGQLQFSVTVAPAELPAISIFQPAVLTYPALPGVPLVLQQSSALPGTNWVTATNAIQLATVNTNQAVFIVPSSGQQMFFRLGVP
jgi:hypothetical protein